MSEKPTPEETEKVLRLVEAELCGHPGPDEKYIFVGGVAHSPRSLLEEMRQGTPLGIECICNELELSRYDKGRGDGA